MKKSRIWLIVALILILLGSAIFSGIMTCCQWDFRKLQNVFYVNNTYTFNEDVSSVMVKTFDTNLEILPSEGNNIEVICHEKKDLVHSVFVQDGILTITNEEAKNITGYMGFSFESPKIQILLPFKLYKDIHFESFSGDIKINNLTFNNIDIKSTTGDSSLVNVLSTENIRINQTTGNVTFDACDATGLYITTTTGDVSGTFLTNKIFITTTNTGDINVPKTSEGGPCNVTTNTGDINLGFSQIK